jgi:hypothetical protein
MRWENVRTAYPGQWLVVEALQAHTENHRRVFDHLAVVEQCPDGAGALQRYRELHRQHADRELYFLHTTNVDPDIEERAWIGIRKNESVDPAGTPGAAAATA